MHIPFCGIVSCPYLICFSPLPLVPIFASLWIHTDVNVGAWWVLHMPDRQMSPVMNIGQWKLIYLVPWTLGAGNLIMFFYSTCYKDIYCWHSERLSYHIWYRYFIHRLCLNNIFVIFDIIYRLIILQTCCSLPCLVAGCWF